MSATANLLWRLLDLADVALMIAGFAVCVEALRQRRRLLALLCALPLPALYIFYQCMDYSIAPWEGRTGPMSLIRWVLGLPPAAVAAFLTLTAVLLCVLWCVLRRRERSEITAMSVKEAADSLPSGLCFYLPGGRVLLLNRAMEALCSQLTGERLVNGERFRDRLFSGRLSDGAEGSLLTLPDGSAWSVSEDATEYEGETLHMLTATDVTELYQKNRFLQAMRRELDALNERLTAYLREIVALSTQKEILAARVRLHDELGADLLVMQHYLREGGTEAERAALEQRLRRNISFLNADPAVQSRDEYQLLMQTARRLNVQILVEGPFPETEPHRHILVTAIHECFTNTLRHARGDCLRIAVEDRGGVLAAVLTNNGAQPAGPIRETGGLRTLRALTERAGGRMTVCVSPEFYIELELPKEETHAAQRIDRG